MRLIAFCEARADFQIARDLVDRVLREAGPSWLADVMDAAPEGIRTYVSDRDQLFFQIRDNDHYVSQLGVRVPHGHFDGKPGVADAVMGRTVFAIARALHKKGRPIDAVLLIRDLDDQPARRDGLEQARAEAAKLGLFRVVLGCPNIMREAWVLVGSSPTASRSRRSSCASGRNWASHPSTTLTA